MLTCAVISAARLKEHLNWLLMMSRLSGRKKTLSTLSLPDTKSTDKMHTLKLQPQDSNDAEINLIKFITVTSYNNYS